MASMNEKDYYAILEVDEKATTDEIRKAFQKKARKLHPDVNKEPDAEERFKEVSEAYAVLSDDDKRKRYDAMRSGMPYAGSYGDSPFGDGFPFGGSWSASWSASWSSSQKNSRSYRPRAGADVAYQVELDSQTATAGTKRGVTYQRFVACDVCNGTGSVEHAEATTCPTCGGAGRMRIDLGGMGLFGVGFFEVTCPECEGSGKVVVDPCSSCGGSGRVLSASEIVIDIPANSHDGDEVRVEGMGNAGTNGREAGDFVCEVVVAEERLSPVQASGFRTIGVGLPFLVLGLIQKGMFAMTAIGAALVAVGVIMVVREGVRSNSRWWGEGGASIINGATTGIVIALLLWFSGPLLSFIAPLLIILFVFAFATRRMR